MCVAVVVNPRCACAARDTLSPSLFLLLIDSLLQALKEANAGVNLEGVYMGSLAHADDLRSLTLDPQSSKQQAEIIDDFLAKNFYS